MESTKYSASSASSTQVPEFLSPQVPFECQSALSTRDFKCSSSAWVPQVLECSSAQVPFECPSDQVPFDYPWIAEFPFECSSSKTSL